MAKACFAMGCFWKPEVVFRSVPGVNDAVVGYCGGHTAEPTYREVCSGRTGHAEAVMVDFDPDQVSYTDLLEVFWANHNPTTRNRQGPDAGSQYRSAIFTADAEQQRAAEASRDQQEAAGRFGQPVVTEIEALKTFYPAKEYHQRYLEKHGAAFS